ncbi:uncharacterized protein LOC121199034 [Toxotes jaculatrix]|uniref:uncharacterized protein LOC121199034 n=1 Tax=Toxotes jaculatrix TaxID=941984 RepID=UPI001B3B142D|nr:uncharacterized protein LOC121199034 [Toxotes jaculatrix]
MAGNSLGPSFLCSLCSASVFIGGCAFLFVIAFPVFQIALGVVYVYECPAAPLIPVYVMLCGILALLLMVLVALPKFLCPTAQSNTVWTVLLISLILFVLIWFFFGSYQVYSVYPPNYDKNITDPNTVNNTIYSPTAPASKLGLTLENQNQSLPNFNQSHVIHNNQSLMKPISTLAPRNTSSKTSGEHLNASQAQRVMAVVPYCNRTVYLFAFWTNTLVYVFAGNALVIFICLYGCMAVTEKVGKYLS